MFDSTVSIASLGNVPASLVTKQRLDAMTVPTVPTAATLPQVEMPTLATPSGPRRDVRPTLSGATGAGIPALVAVRRPVGLPDVDWSFVAAVPEPPHRGHDGVNSRELDPLAATGAAQ